MIKGYSDLTITTPDCRPDLPIWALNCKIDSEGDVSELFPYINAIIEKASMYDKPNYIRFTLKNVQCALYPEKVAATPFSDREEALEFISYFIDFLNDINARKSSIKPNHTITRQVPVLEIYKSLPRTNCKQCGYPSCMAFANAISRNEAVIAQCSEHT